MSLQRTEAFVIIGWLAAVFTGCGGGSSASGGASSGGGPDGGPSSSGGSATDAGTKEHESGGTAHLGGGSTHVSGTNGGGTTSVTTSGGVGGIVSTGTTTGGAGGSSATCSSGVKDPSGNCVACTLTCTQSGQTGALYPVTTQSGVCMCESSPGYFFSAQGAMGTYPCDADGDGWVRDSAKAAIESQDPSVKANSKCTLRVVSEIILRNENDETFALYPTNNGVDLTTDINARAGTLPLYESVRNDEQRLLDGNSKVPQYGSSGRSLKAEEINSLTKACVTATADHNDNGINDVEEWAAPPNSQITVSPQSAGRDPFLNVYTRLSYFTELHNAWFKEGVPSDTETSSDAGASHDAGTSAQGGSPNKPTTTAPSALTGTGGASASGASVTGVYYIEERGRSSSTFGLVNNPAAKDTYWQICSRYRDSFYADGSDAITYDFASISGPKQAATWGGMLHHSQFKCVENISEADYAAMSDQQKRTQLYKQSASSMAKLGWDMNACSVSGSLDPGGADSVNPRPPFLACSYQSNPPVLNQVFWAASNYQDYSVTGGYIRGCVNECVEDYSNLPECHSCSHSIYGKATVSNVAVGLTCSMHRTCDSTGGCTQCVAPFADCNQNQTDGCETDTSTASNHCGQCNKDCNGPITAGAASALCVSSQCKVASCQTGKYDIDGNYTNGCECSQSTFPSSCDSAYPASSTSIAIDGSTAVSGNITPQDKVDWFTVSFATGASCAYNPKIVLNNNGAPIAMQVLTGTCSAQGSFACSETGTNSGRDITTWEFTYGNNCAADSTNSPTPNNGSGLGINPNSQSGPFINGDNFTPSGPIYIKVYSTGSSTTCLNYTLTFSN